MRASDSATPSYVSFFATPWPWLAHAAAWSAIIVVVNATLQLVYLGPPLVAFAVAAAFVSSRLLRGAHIEALPKDVARFALVDAVLCGTAALVLLAPAAWLLQYLPANPLSYAGYGLALVVGAFVPFFYASLAAFAALERRPDASRRLPPVIAAAAVLIFGAFAWGPTSARVERNRELAAKVAEYEAETGRPAEPVEINILLSLHGFDERTYALALDENGRAAVVGDFTFYGGHEARGFARLENDGRLDRAATTAALAATAGRGVAAARALGDGGLLVALRRPNADWQQSTLLRLHADGALVSQPEVALFGEIYPAFDVRADGSLLVAGGEPAANDGPPECVRRFLPSGERDAAFSAAVGTSLDSQQPGIARRCAVTALHALPNDKTLVVLSGTFDGQAWHDGLIRRLHADGRLDDAFLPEVEGARVVAIGPTQEIFVATLPPSSAPAVFSLVKLREDGTRDASFAPPEGLPLGAALAVQNDGALLTSGDFSAGVARVLPDGRLDTTFGDDGVVALTGSAKQIVAAANGDIYLVGEFFDVSARGVRLERSSIVRLSADGTPDAAFDPR